MTAQHSRRIADRYELKALPMPGGMGVVWEGYDTVLDRPVAIKQIRADKACTPAQRAEMVSRFRREAKVTAKIEHPGVPTVYDAAIDKPAASSDSSDAVAELYLVMQLVRGDDLRDVLAQHGALPVAWAVSIAAQICSVLSYAHAVPVVHRDLKPSNIMIDIEGRVKVLDFGVASVLGTDVTQITETGRMVGTREYMAPEQFLGVGVSPRSDLYALGCVLHEMLAGEKVFDGNSDPALQHVHEDPIPLRVLRPEVPEELERLVLDLLEKAPEHRPDTAQNVHERLVAYLPVGGCDDGIALAGVADPTRPYHSPLAPKAKPSTPARPFVPHPPTELCQAAASQSEPPTLFTPAFAAPHVSEKDIGEAEELAVRLFGEERYSQAAGVLEEILEQARQDDPRLVETRRVHAAVMLAGGNYRRALTALQQLASAVSGVTGPESKDIREYRQQIALCHAVLGEHEQALDAYRALLPGAEQKEALVLRQKIADLLLALHRVREAAEVLLGLLHDLAPASPEARRVHDLLMRIQITGGTWH
ncbi:protein kinase [Streptomyces sp. NPDC059558]|uniref:protein kinase domain-containing protein n=1 Tax=Streptomyces sp. NPDC059558 TaxID=3346864 RepID=UPI0036BB852F